MKSSNQNSNVKMPFTRRPQLILFILTACCVISMGYYYIKKENIGLIEVMGLAVLPARLKGEMELLKEYIIEKKDIRSNDQIAKHADWTDAFLSEYDNVTEENIEQILEQEVGKVFCKVLEDAGVYKCTDEGIKAFKRFISTL